MSSIVETMRELNGTTATIASAVGERTQVAAGMAANAEAVAEDVRKVALAIEAIRYVARENAEGAALVRGSARQIAVQTEAIRQQVAFFATHLVLANGASDVLREKHGV